jgi:hypothetical protein
MAMGETGSDVAREAADTLATGERCLLFASLTTSIRCVAAGRGCRATCRMRDEVHPLAREWSEQGTRLVEIVPVFGDATGGNAKACDLDTKVLHSDTCSSLWTQPASSIIGGMSADRGRCQI